MPRGWRRTSPTRPSAAQGREEKGTLRRAARRFPRPLSGNGRASPSPARRGRPSSQTTNEAVALPKRRGVPPPRGNRLDDQWVRGRGVAPEAAGQLDRGRLVSIVAGKAEGAWRGRGGRSCTGGRGFLLALHSAHFASQGILESEDFLPALRPLYRPAVPPVVRRNSAGKLCYEPLAAKRKGESLPAAPGD